MNVEAIHPVRGVGQKLRAGMLAEAIAGAHSDQLFLGVSGLCSDDVQLR